jgi:hypothetical protein
VPVVERPLREGVVDFLPIFRLSGIVDEACDKNLSESLTALQHTLPHNSGAAKWPKLVVEVLSHMFHQPYLLERIECPRNFGPQV